MIENPNKGIFIIIGVAAVIVIVMLVFIISSNTKQEKEQNAEVQEEQTEETPEEIAEEEFADPLPKYKDVTNPERTRDIESFANESYKDIKLVAQVDLKVTGNLKLEGVYLELRGNSLILDSGSSVEIKNSVIAHAAESQGDSGGFVVRSSNFTIKDSAIIESLGHGIYLSGAKGPIISNTQFFDNRWAAIFSTDTSNLEFTSNTVVSNGCKEPLSERERQYCIRDSVDFNSIEIVDPSGGFSLRNNLITSYVMLSGSMDGVEVRSNNFLFAGGLIVEGEKVTGTIDSNIAKEGVFIFDIKNANGLRVDQNEIGRELICRSSDTATHNWADVLGLNFIKGEEVTGHCSIFE